MGVEIAFEMIEEDAADAAMDLAVGEVEIVLRPFGEARIESRVVRVAGGAKAGVELGGILRIRQSAG